MLSECLNTKATWKAMSRQRLGNGSKDSPLFFSLSLSYSDLKVPQIFFRTQPPPTSTILSSVTMYYSLPLTDNSLQILRFELSGYHDNAMLTSCAVPHHLALSFH